MSELRKTAERLCKAAKIGDDTHDMWDDLRSALAAEPEQEPVGFGDKSTLRIMKRDLMAGEGNQSYISNREEGRFTVPLYTNPQRNLSDEEMVVNRKELENLNAAYKEWSNVDNACSRIATAIHRVLSRKVSGVAPIEAIEAKLNGGE